MESILAHPTHMYKSPALQAQGRSTTPLSLSAGKQQTHELAPSKINTHNNIQEFYQRREVEGTMPQMEHRNIMPTRHNGTSNYNITGHNGTSNPNGTSNIISTGYNSNHANNI